MRHYLKHKIGDRVSDEFFGEGTVVKRWPNIGYYSVMWDTAPPIEYNMGCNPALWRPDFREIAE